MGRYKPLFELDNYHLESYKTWDRDSQTVGRIFVTAQGKRSMGAAVGVGPVGVLHKALCNALEVTYPYVKNLVLTDFSVRVLNAGESSTDSKVRLFISWSDGQRSWDTVGVHDNIIEASWQALVDSFEYYGLTMV